MRLILPQSLDGDINQRLSLEGIISFLGSLDLTKAQNPSAVDHLLNHPELFIGHWTETEVNYLLYGQEIGDELVCKSFHFDYYNFMHYLDTDNPEEMARNDICSLDSGFPHVHVLASNPISNVNPDNEFLGTLHSHPLLGFIAKSPKSPDDVGFSPPDLDWNARYLERYGRDGRRLAFVIYYSDKIFYRGISQTKTTKPELIDITIAGTK